MDMTEIDECPICMETFELGINKADQILTECGHTFCVQCFITLKFKSNKCPICRQYMNISLQNSTIDFITLYNQIYPRPEEIPQDVPPSMIHIYNHPHICQRIFNYLNSWSSYHRRVYPI